MGVFNVIFLKFFILIAIVAGFQACSTKKPGDRDSNLTKQDRDGENEAERSGNSSEPPDRYYYSDVQLVIETSPEGTCETKVTGELVEKPKVILTDDLKLDLPLGPDSFRLFTLNVSMQVMGFDSANYSFSALDGVAPKSIPFGIRFKRKPGNILELHYLNQIVQMVLQNTPVFNFSATEKRGNCTLNHTVNVFGERTAYYPKLAVE